MLKIRQQVSCRQWQAAVIPSFESSCTVVRQLSSAVVCMLACLLGSLEEGYVESFLSHELTVKLYCIK